MLVIKYAIMVLIVANQAIVTHRYERGNIQYVDTIIPSIMSLLMFIALAIERGLF